MVFSQAWWFMSIIPATWEGENERIEVWGRQTQFQQKKQGVVTYVCNPSYSGGLPFRQAWAKKVRPYLKHNWCNKIVWGEAKGWLKWQSVYIARVRPCVTKQPTNKWNPCSFKNVSHMILFKSQVGGVHKFLQAVSLSKLFIALICY
jgi:hypothetical protein